MRAILAIAATELRIGMRNRWVLLATGLLIVFSLVLAFLGSAPAGDVKATRLAITVASLATLSVYLVPLIALLLTFDSIAGEVERGTLPLLLATPVSRSAVIIGKVTGQLAVVAIAIMIGFGATGALIALQSGANAAGVTALLRLIATAIALGGAFVAIGTVASTAVRQSGTAAAVSVAIWLLAVVLYDLGLLGALVASGDGFFAKSVFPWLLFANPADAFRLYNLAALDLGSSATGLSAAHDTLPVAPSMALAAIAAWFCAALGAAIMIFRRLEP